MKTLRHYLDELRDPRHAGPSLFAGAIGLLLGVTLGALLLGAKEAPTLKTTAERSGGRSPEVVDLSDLTPTQESPGEDGDSGDDGLSKSQLGEALEDAKRRAEAFDGTAQAGIWVDGVESLYIGDETPMRMWSMSKPVVALALLRASKGALRPGLDTAMRDAIVRSDNCAVRLLTLELQKRTGGPDGARAAFAGVLGDAEVDGGPVGQQKPAEPVCHEYLRAQGGNPSYVTTPAVLFGTAKWTIVDALRFAAALSQGKYGEDGERILDLMDDPKERDPHTPAGDFTANLQFGAGVALVQWDPAYKGGWGGSQNDDEHFLSGQIVVLDAGSRRVAIAAMFHPTAEPERDDPGKLDADRALEAMFRALDGRVLKRLGDPP